MEKIQHILDHWHVGVVERVQPSDSYMLAKTNQGDFALVESDSLAALARARADLLAADLLAEPLTKPAQAHVTNKHYQLWRVTIAPPEKRYKIRGANESDYADIESMAQALHKLDYKGVPGLLKPNPPAITSRGTFLNILEDEETTYLVAEHAGNLVGYLYGNVEQEETDLSAAITTANIGELFVQQPHRRQGVATSLITYFTRWAKEHQASRLVTVVYSYAKPASVLYTHIGLNPRSIKLDRPLDQTD